MKTKHLLRVVTSELGVVPAVQLHDQSNYLKVLPGGHCFLCHEDYPNDHNPMACLGKYKGGPVPCEEKCKGSEFYTPNFPTWVTKK